MQTDIKSRKLDKNSIGDAVKMTREERDISFLNNYFIYKKVRNVDIADIKSALIKSSDAEQIEAAKESLQAVEAVKETTKQVEKVEETIQEIEKAEESIKSSSKKSSSKIKIKPKSK